METELYHVRWLILVLLFTMQVLNNFNFAGSGLINNFYVTYFGVPYAAVDWIVLGSFVGSIVITPVITLLIFLNLLRFRRLIMLSAFLVVIAFLCFVSALLSNRLFFMTVTSEILGGIPATVLDILPGVFAALWFPENQVGTAISVVFVGTSVGNVLGSIVLTHAVRSSSSLQFHQDNQSDKLHINFTTSSTTTEETRINLLKINGVLSVISIFCLVLLIKFAKDVPLLPPTIAQASKREQESSEAPKLNWRKVLADSKVLWTDWTFVSVCIIFGIEYHINTFEYTLLGEMLRDTNSKMSTEQSTVIAGYTVTCFCVGACVGCFLAGFLMNRYKKYKIQTITGCASSFIASVGFLLGFQTQHLWLMMASNALYGIATRVGMVPLYDMITQHTYPMDETFSSAWLTCFQSLFAIVSAEFARLLYQHTRSLGVLIFHSGSLFLSLLLTLFIKPKYNRILTNRDSTNHKSMSDRQPLDQKVCSDNEST